MIGNPLLLPDEGYNISRSVRLRSSASAYFNRTLSANSTSSTTCTWSGWAKRGALGVARATLAYHGNAGGSGGMISFEFASDTLRCFHDGTNFIQTSAVYRDPSAWYHLVLVYDSTQATASNRLKLFVNGFQVTAFSTANYPALNQSINAGSTNVQNLGLVSTAQFDGYLTEINFIDGQALTPSSFGETNPVTGVWQPKKYAGTYGTNGFYLNFSDNSNNTAATIGKDYSGNGNNWTPNNISVTAGTTYDSMLDVPTQWADGGNGRGNYPTLNNVDGGIARTTISNGNLSALFTGTAAGAGIRSSGFQMPTSGKWYAEFTLVAKPTLGNTSTVGISRSDTILNSTANWYLGTAANDYAWYWLTGTSAKLNNGANAGSYGTAPAVGDVIGVAVDLDTNPGAFTLTFYNNGVSQGAAWTNQSTGGQTFSFGCSGTDSTNFAANFGQRPFSYTPPSGFKALNTLNLPAPTILKGNQYFDALTWSGAGGSSRSITGLAFQPDLVWGKVRNTTYGHMLFDSARGAGSLKELGTNVTGAEGYASSNQYGYLSAFNSDGFTVTAGTDASIPNAYWNQSGNTYVGWQWKEGATQGFDIVTYTGTGSGTTVAHNLGVAPSWVIIKQRSASGNYFVVWARGTTSTSQALWLGATNAVLSTPNYWNSTAPTASVFSVGTDSATNGSGSTYIAYLFSEVAGFSRFGSYTGNGSTDGPFVFCGFRPRFVMIKGSSFTSNWFIQDGARNGYNVNTGVALRPNLSNAEDGTTFYDMDLLSNGFKLRTSTGDSNSSGATFIFAAFAENPFKNSLAR